jgi:Homeodomain-like domain
VLDLDPSDLSDLPIMRRRKPGAVPWEALDVDPSDFPLPRPPKPGPPTWDGLIDRQYRVGRMAFLLLQGYSLRAIAKDLGVARTTVDRMKPDMAWIWSTCSIRSRGRRLGGSDRRACRCR